MADYRFSNRPASPSACTSHNLIWLGTGASASPLPVAVGEGGGVDVGAWVGVGGGGVDVGVNVGAGVDVGWPAGASVFAGAILVDDGAVRDGSAVGVAGTAVGVVAAGGVWVVFCQSFIHQPSAAIAHSAAVTSTVPTARAVF